jgi:hypothetical protein
MTKQEKFKQEMYDYANINEYYSFFGNVIYVSSSYYDNLDYFLVLRLPKNLAVVSVSAADRLKFSKKTNRDHVVEDLNELQPNVHWVVPAGFHNHVTGLLQDKYFPDRNELIRLKNNDINVWNRFFVEDAVRKFKLDHTLLSRGINFNSIVKGGYMTTFTTADGIYGTNFGVLSEWVSGNAFFDVKLKYFSDVKVRRLYYYDLAEFAELLGTLANRIEQPSLEAISKFTSV